MKSSSLLVLVLITLVLDACQSDSEVISTEEEVITVHEVFAEDFLAKWEASSLLSIRTEELEKTKYVSFSDTAVFMEDAEDRGKVIEAISSTTLLRLGFVDCLIQNQEKLQGIQGAVYIIETFDLIDMCKPYVYEVYLFSDYDSTCVAYKFTTIYEGSCKLRDLACSDIDLASYYSGLEFVFNYQYSDPIIYSRIGDDGEITSKVMNNYDDSLGQTVDKLWRVKY